MSARMQILEYLAKNGLTSLDDLQSGLGLSNRKRLLDNTNAAMNDGMLARVKDDVTNQPAYRLTSKGSARVKNGNQTVNGKRAAENKAACDMREADAECEEIVANITQYMAENAALKKRVETLERDEAGYLNSLAEKTDRTYDAEEALKKVRQNWLDLLTALDVRTHEEALHEISNLHKPCVTDPIGYAVMVDAAEILPTESDARTRAVRVLEESGLDLGALHVVAVIASAELKVEWREAA